MFEALGVTDPAERRQWRERLDDELRKFYQHGRQLEEIAQENRVKAASKKQTAGARSVARDIWREVDKAIFRRFPEDFVLLGTPVERYHLPEGEVLVGRHLFTEGEILAAGYVQIGDDLRFVGSITKAEFLQAWQQAGNTGLALVPQDEDACWQVLDAYRQYRNRIDQTLLELAAGRTADEHLQMQVVSLLWRHIGEHLRVQAT